MPSTILEVLQSAPLNATVMAVNCVIWFWMWNRRYGYEDVSTSYQKVVVERQFYRVVTATFCHLNFLHLVFNMGSLYTVGVLESALGTYFYFHRTMLLIFISEGIWMLITYVLVKRFNMERFATSSAVGYSGVIFGWMTILQLYQPSFAIPLPGFNIPIAIAPFISLFITQLLVPQASFLGHLSGIFAGYLIGFGLFDWLSGYWFFTSLAYAAAVIVLSLKANGNLVSLLRCISVSPEFMRRTGMGAPTASIGSASNPTARRYMTAEGVLRVDRPVEAASDTEAGGGAVAGGYRTGHVAIPVSAAMSASGGAAATPSVARATSASLARPQGSGGGATATSANGTAGYASGSPIDLEAGSGARAQPMPQTLTATAAGGSSRQSPEGTPVLLGFSAPSAANSDLRDDPLSLGGQTASSSRSGSQPAALAAPNAGAGSSGSGPAPATAQAATNSNNGSTGMASILAAAASRRMQASSRRGLGPGANADS